MELGKRFIENWHYHYNSMSLAVHLLCYPRVFFEAVISRCQTVPPPSFSTITLFLFSLGVQSYSLLLGVACIPEAL